MSNRFQVEIPSFCVKGSNDGYSLGLAKWEKRAIEEPVAEGGIRGSREGFTESLAGRYLSITADY